MLHTKRSRIIVAGLAIMIAVVCSLAVIVRTDASTQTIGLFQNDPGSFNGYTLFAPLGATTTYLIDNQGREVHSWASSYRPGLSAYLLEDGSLLRPSVISSPDFNVGGAAGAVSRYDWDGSVLWHYEYSNSNHRQHHDVELLPNGNILMVAFEYHSQAEAIAAGRDPALMVANALWSETIVEVEPTSPTTGNIVWKWDAWDHLIQDFDPLQANYGVVADHPELMDINYIGDSNRVADWLHANSVNYNADLDQIVISYRTTGELWIIDHSTTTAEAASHAGGTAGKGGDILYRWGNPETYRAGTAPDRQLFGQHDAHWIPEGLPGAGNILVFNNGNGRPGGNYSSSDEIVPPAVDAQGNYPLTLGQAYAPAAPVWTHALPVELYSPFISGTARLANGNTIITSGGPGTIVEVTDAGQTVWKYVNPVSGAGPLVQGNPPTGNTVFRSYRYAASYPAFVGKNLAPGGPIWITPTSTPTVTGTRTATPTVTTAPPTPTPTPQMYSQLMTSESGGTLVDDYGDSLSVPAGALSEDTKITLDLIGPEGTPPLGLLQLSRAFRFGPAGTTFLSPVTASFNYVNLDYGATDPLDLEAYLFDAGTGSWSALGGTVSTASQTVTIQTEHFSTFGLFRDGTVDTDGDGCTDLTETGPSVQSGGQRDWRNFWDYYDTPSLTGLRDGRVRIDDVLAVLRRYFADDSGGTAPVNRTSDPLSVPPPEPAYHPAFDRSPPVGPPAMHLGPADGKITIADVVAVLGQYHHDCV